VEEARGVNVPAELRERPQWVVWRSEMRNAEPTKVPYQARSHQRASTSDPATWATCEEALLLASTGQFDGIGYVFSPEDGFVGVDLDDCLDGDRLHPDAGAIVARLDSYTEISPSSRGVKVICEAALNGFPRHRTGQTGWGGEFEVYDQGRYFTITTKHLRGTPTTVEPRQAELGRVLEFVFGRMVAPKDTPAPIATGLGGDDEELLERARAANNGPKFDRLWGGDWGEYGSRSEADLALCGLLAFWTGPDPARVDSLFRRGGLMRGKWDERHGETTYGAQTIEKALEGRIEFYSPQPSSAPRTAETVGVSAGDQSGTVPPSFPHREDGGDGTAPSEGEGTVLTPETVAPFALPLDEFIAERTEMPVALVGDEAEALLPFAGLAILFAKGGRGKTTLAAEAALHMAAGLDYLGFSIARPLRVLFVENEGPREPFRAKLELKHKLWDHEIAGALFVHTFSWGAFSLADEATRSRLRTFVVENQIDVVIGDPLDTLGIEGVGSPEETRNFMLLLADAGLFRDTAFLLLHHPRKEGAQDELDELSGAWGGKPDTILRLDKLEDNRARLSFPKVRWSRLGARRALILAFDPDTESFTVAHEEEDEERDYLAEVEALLADGTWRVAREIAAPKKNGGIGASFETVKTLLEQHPTRFVSRNGAEVGRSAQATVWHVASDPGAVPEPDGGGSGERRAR
jgi:putative DNA primase/helicase